MESKIRHMLIERLAAVYGPPKNPDGLARELAGHCPTWATEDALEALAGRIISSRKQRGFPAASELIRSLKSLAPPGARSSTGYVSEADKAKEAWKKRNDALESLRGSALASQAVSERWAPALIEFVENHQRMPGSREIEGCIALSRENDRLAAEEGGMMGHVLQGLRQSMHDSAARELGLGAGSFQRPQAA